MDQHMDTTPAAAGFPAAVKQEQLDAAFAPPSLAPFTASSAFPAATQQLGGAAAAVPGAASAPHPAAATTAVSPVIVKQELGTAQTVPPVLFAPQPGPSSMTTSAPGYEIPPVTSFKLENVAQDLRLEAERRMNQGPASKRPRLVVHSGADTEVNGLLSELHKATRRIAAAAANRNLRRQGRQQRRSGAMQAISKTVDELQRQVAEAKRQQNSGAGRRLRLNRRRRKQRVDDKIMAGLRARLGRLRPQKRSEAYLRIQEALHKVEFGSSSE